MLRKEELQRYNRQMLLPEIGVSGQQNLQSARVLIIGAGGLGCPVLQYLAAAGVGTLGIVDHDTIDLSNLHRQILYTDADVGMIKVEVAKQRLKEINPCIAINTYPEKLTADNALALIGAYDIVVDGSDNFPTRYLINDSSAKLGKPLVFGSILRFEGQIAVFNYQNGPGYTDVFPEPPEEGLSPNCSDIGVIGVLPGIIGTYVAAEVIKIITGIGETLSGKLLTLDILTHSHNIFRINKSNSATQRSTRSTIEAPIQGNEITLETLQTWLNEMPEKIFLIDVRENYEFEENNIGGLNLPLYELQDNYTSIPKGRRIVFLCETGQRSRIAINLVGKVLEGTFYSVKGGLGQKVFL